MILPPQKITMAEKAVRDATTGKNNIEETIDFYIGGCNWTKHTQEILSLFDSVEGTINSLEYKGIQNPFNQNTENGDLPKYNAQLQNYNILKGVANLLIGEFGRRNHDFSVISIGPDDEVTYKDGLDVLIKGYYSQQVINQLKELGLELGQEVKQLPPLEEYVQGYKDKFDTARVIAGQEALDYIKYNCDLDNKYLDLYWDWLVTGRFYSYKTVNNDDVDFEVVPVHELYVPYNRHKRLVEDAPYAVRRKIMPVFEVVDFFKDRLDDDIMDALELQITQGLGMQFTDMQFTGRNGAIRLPTLYSNGTNNSIVNSAINGIELYHVVYKTWRDYYVLYYNDELGIERQMQVGTDYKLNKTQGDIKLVRRWENILYEGYKCLDYYLDCGVFEEGRSDLNNEGLQKLPYNGIHERSSTGEVQSIIKEGLPYQRITNVLHYQMEKLINKNKDKLLVMPMGLVPTKKGIDTKTQMYHADATSILWVDESAPGFQVAAQVIKSIDMSLGSYIKDTINLIQYIKQEYWDSIGMNKQRYGDVDTSAGKGVTEQAIMKSSIITYELTRQFDMIVEKDYQGLLDISKLAWVNGKKGNYIRSDGSIAFLKLNQDDAIKHSESSFNVFVRDASEDTEAINAIRAQATNLVQNGGDTSVLGHIFGNKSIPKLTKILEKLEDNKKQFDQLTAKNQQEADAGLEQMRLEAVQAELEVRRYVSDNALEGVKYSADKRAEGNDIPQEAKPANDVEIALAQHKMNTDDVKLKQVDKKLQIDLKKANQVKTK